MLNSNIYKTNPNINIYIIRSKTSLQQGRREHGINTELAGRKLL